MAPVRDSEDFGKGAVSLTHQKEAQQMMATKYNSRVIELFKSGAATPAQWAELVEAVGCAFERDMDTVAEIHKAIGLTAEQKVNFDEEDARFLPERTAALAAAGSEDEKLRMIMSSAEATERKAEQAGDCAWEATLQRLQPSAPGIGVAVVCAV
jgi:hypothetical protein